MNVDAILITAVSTVLVAAITAGGTWMVARQGRKAQQETNEVTAEAAELASSRAFAGVYMGRLEKLEEREGKLHDRMSDVEEQLRKERLKRESLSRQLEEERKRMTALEARFRKALDRIQKLLAILAQHDIEVPPDLRGDDLP